MLERERAHLLRQVDARGCARPARTRGRRRGTGWRAPSRDGRRRCPSARTSSCRCALISARFLTLCVPAWRLASCQRTQRCRMSARGSSPKISSESVDRAGRLAVERGDLEFHVTLPPAGASAARPLGGAAARCAVAGARNLPGFGTSFGSAFFTASRTVIQPPLAPGTAPSTRIRPRSTSVCTTLQIQRGDPLDAHMAGHLLVLERLARILAAAGRTDASGARPTRRGRRAGRRSSSASCRRRSPCRSRCRSHRRTGRRRNDRR